jgi:PAS domain S-box-containing protein
MWFEVSYAPVYDEDGKIMGVSFNATDINQRKQAEQKLIESEYMLSAIYNSTSEASSFVGLDFKLLYFNKVASEMIQDMFQKEPQIGDDYFDYILPHLKEEFRQDFEEVLKGNTIRKEKTDGAKWYQFSIFPVYNLNNELVGLADNVIDITESKQNELQIIAQNEKLKAIAWHQAHKVRRPVATILGLIALIKEENDLSEILLYIDFLQHATNELDQVIHTIVGYTQDIK